MSKNEYYFSKHLLRQVGSRTSQSKVDWIEFNYKKYLPVRCSASILEIGPGSGDLLSLLVKKLGYIHTTAIDISNEVVIHCNEIAPNSTMRVDSTEDFLNKAAEKYDMIFMLQVLEHIPKDQTIALLRSISKALKEGGVAIIEVPNVASSVVGVESFFSDFTHEVAYTNTSLEYVMNAAGFTGVEIHCLEVPIISLGRRIQAILQNSIISLTRIFKNIFNPNRPYYGTQSIYAVVKK